MSGFNDKANSNKKKQVSVKRSSNQKKAVGSAHSPSVDEDEFDTINDEEDENSLQQSVLQSKKIMIVAGAVVGVILFFVVVNLVMGLFNKPSEPDNKDTQKDSQVVVDNNVNDEQDKPDEPNQNQQQSGTTIEEDFGTDEGTYGDNLTLSRVEPVWEYLSSQDVKDFCNYEKHRSVLGNGLELYWLDCTYKDMPYIIQVEYTTYMSLEQKGIIPVIMEETTTTENVKLITHMKVDTDYLKRLKK